MMNNKTIVDFISNDYKAPSFNGEIKIDIDYDSIHSLFQWLDKKGILKRVSFMYEKLRKDGCVCFALKTIDLLPYIGQIKTAPIKGLKAAMFELFEAKYTPCVHCGAVSLMHFMGNYRDVLDGLGYGCYERSWECCRCVHRWSYKAIEVSTYFHHHSSEQTIKKFWSDFGEKRT